MVRATLAIGFAGFLQMAAAQPAFEVASIRQNDASVERRPLMGDNVRLLPDGVIMRNVSFRGAIRWAYKVFDYQIQGPDWLNSVKFDISAKAAAPATEEQIRQMTQALLGDRLKLKVHRQTKELAAYVLTVGKEGPKFRESKEEGESEIQPNKERLEIVVRRVPLAQMVETLSTFLRAPVIDTTGLTGRYDITISVSKYMPDGKEAVDPVNLIMMGIQAELGLKLESKKMPLEMVIVDQAERAPTEN